MSLRVGGLTLQTGGSTYDPNAGSVTHNNFTGFIYYGDTQYPNSSPEAWTGGQVTQIVNNGEVIPTKSYISTDLTSVNFLQDNKFMPLNIGDTYLLRLSFAARSSTSGNTMTVQLVSPTVIQQDTQPFVINAGDETLFTFNYTVACLDELKNNGGTFQGWTDYDCSVYNVGLLVIPVSRL